MNLTALTTAQRAVFDQMLEGKTDKEIAQALGRSFLTVQTHSRQVLKALNAPTRFKLVVRYYREQLAAKEAA